MHVFILENLALKKRRMLCCSVPLRQPACVTSSAADDNMLALHCQL